MKGWSLVGATAIVLIVTLACIAFAAPDGNEAAHIAIRATARLSAVLFLLAFTASAAWQLWPGTFTQWQRQNRRYLGVSFALSHFIHLAAILSLSILAPEDFATIPATTWVLGGLAYALIAAMTITSFDRTARWLGPKAWSLLHTVGVYYVWVVFANSYAIRALTLPEYVPVAVVVFAALGLRIVAKLRRRRADTAAATTAVDTGG